MAKYSLASSTWDQKELDAIQGVIQSDMYTMGAKVSEYEKKFADYFGSRHAVMVSSGSTANLLMIAALFFTKNPKLKRGVLGTYHPGLEHREAGGHPHDQYAANQEVKRIERIAQFCKLVHQVFPVIQEKLYVVGRRCVGRPIPRRRHALRYEYE